MIRVRLGTAALSVLVWWGVSACNDGQSSERHSFLPEHGTGPAVATTVPAPLDTVLEPGMLATVKAAPVERWKGPGDRPFSVAVRTSKQEAGHPRRFGSITLETALRERPVSQYPCTSCHFGRTVVMSEDRIGDAHQNIQPVHPQQTGAECSTCHSAENVEQLQLEQGDLATLNQSYRLCAQCHFRQVEAWSNGAHGKRLDGWQGRRIVMGCGDCHDPHRPAVGTRIPFQAPQLERPKEGGR